MKNFLERKPTLESILVILAGASFVALLGAYISQYVFGYQPCVLCLYQRVPFFVVIGLVLFSLVLKTNRALKIIIVLSLAALIVNVGIAFYHVGVENKIFSGFSGCSGAGDLNNISNVDDLKQALIEQPSVKCDEPQFYFLGLTMAFWNMLYCLALFGATIFAMKKAKLSS